MCILAAGDSPSGGLVPVQGDGTDGGSWPINRVRQWASAKPPSAAFADTN